MSSEDGMETDWQQQKNGTLTQTNGNRHRPYRNPYITQQELPQNQMTILVLLLVDILVAEEQTKYLGFDEEI